MIDRVGISDVGVLGNSPVTGDLAASQRQMPGLGGEAGGMRFARFDRAGRRKDTDGVEGGGAGVGGLDDLGGFVPVAAIAAAEEVVGQGVGTG